MTHLVLDACTIRYFSFHYVLIKIYKLSCTLQFVPILVYGLIISLPVGSMAATGI